MAETLIKRGIARRLGLVLPQHVVTMRVEPDLTSWAKAWCRSVAHPRAARIDWGGVSIEAHQAALRGGDS